MEVITRLQEQPLIFFHLKQQINEDDNLFVMYSTKYKPAALEQINVIK